TRFQNPAPPRSTRRCRTPGWGQPRTRSNPGAHAVATSDDAGQVRGGTHCCSPSYLVMVIRDTARTIANEDTAWSYRAQWLPAAVVGPSAGSRRPAGRHSGASPLRCMPTLRSPGASLSLSAAGHDKKVGLITGDPRAVSPSVLSVLSRRAVRAAAAG